MSRGVVWSRLLIVVAALACGKKETGPPPPAEVLVAPPVQRDVPLYAEWVGTVEGSVTAQIRPKVSGYVLTKNYAEGTVVRQGEVLFELDPRLFQAALDGARGQLIQAQATLQKAEKDVERYTPLVPVQAVSQKELDDAVSRRDLARGTVDAAKAAVEQAQLNFQWATVRTPITGIAGIATSQVGDLVGPTTVMTTVSTVDPAKVTFNISGQEYLKFAGEIKAGTARASRERNVPLELVLEGDTLYPQKGRIIVADRQVDPQTGTLALQGQFPNPGGILRPGQFGRVRAVVGMAKNALLVPQRAVNELQGSYQVGTVGADGKAVIKVVTTGPKIGSLWVIEKGLDPGDKVIVEGLQRVRPGAAVSAKPAPPDTAGNSGPASGQPSSGT